LHTRHSALLAYMPATLCKWQNSSTDRALADQQRVEHMCLVQCGVMLLAARTMPVHVWISRCQWPSVVRGATTMKGLLTPAYCFSQAITAMDCAVLPRPICTQQQQQQQQQQQGGVRREPVGNREQHTQAVCMYYQRSSTAVTASQGTMCGKSVHDKPVGQGPAAVCDTNQQPILLASPHLISQDAVARPPLAVAHLSPVVVHHPLEAGLLQAQPATHNTCHTHATISCSQPPSPRSEQTCQGNC
jgi:hypothetical protein